MEGIYKYQCEFFMKPRPTVFELKQGDITPANWQTPHTENHSPTASQLTAKGNPLSLSKGGVTFFSPALSHIKFSLHTSRRQHLAEDAIRGRGGDGDLLEHLYINQTNTTDRRPSH